MGDDAPENSKGKYGVKLIRGPFVQLTAHPDECEDEEAFLAYAARLHAEGHRGVMRLDEVRHLDRIPTLGTGKTDYVRLGALAAEKSAAPAA